MADSFIKLIECPRDAMQSWPHMISTEHKIEYLNELLQVGFDTLDFGSFVSPKAIPQMADTAEVLKELKWKESSTKLLAIVANERGAQQAASFEAISFLGFPFSVSETFQFKNTNSSITTSPDRVKAIQEICMASRKELVVYISMGFGNPYGDPYDEAVVLHWIDKLVSLGVRVISLADTVGLASAEQVRNTTSKIIAAFPETEIGVHLHSTSLNWEAKLESAIQAGCRRVDGALKGIGGCPMADNELVGNMDMEKMIPWLESKGFVTRLNKSALSRATQSATKLFV